MNILILNSDLPVFPGWGGIEFLNTTQLARHADNVGLVSAVHTQEQLSKLSGLTDAGVKLYLWRSPQLGAPEGLGAPASRGLREAAGYALHLVNRARRACMPPAFSRPADTHMRDFQFRNMAPQIYNAMKDRSWHVLVVIQSSCAHWIDLLPRFPVSVLVMHDARALVYQREAQAAPTLLRKWAAALEYKRYLRFEQHYCRRFDHVMTVSQPDAEWIRTHCGPKRLTTLPIPVDADYFAPRRGVPEDPNLIMFTGTMNHPPNADAVQFFAHTVFPLILRELPDARFRIVGRCPTPAVSALNALPGITVSGFVEDIRAEMAEASVMVVPIRFGAGMRQKILEAWAMRKCVVSTAIGAEGIDYTDGGNLLIADTAVAMARAVLRCLRSGDTRTALKAGGIEIVKSQHAPALIGQRLFDAIAQTAAEERREPAEAMRAVIDLRWMFPGVAGGIENLSRAFLEQLYRLDRDSAYTLITPTEIKYDFVSPRHPNIRVVSVDNPMYQTGAMARRIFRLGLGLARIDYWKSWEVEQFNRALRYRADIALSVPGYIHPELCPLSNVLIMTDLQHKYYPQFFTEREIEERERLYSESARCADHICAISEFTRQSLLKHWQIDPGKTSTTHLAAAAVFHPGSLCRGNPRAVLQRYGLQDAAYVFFPGNTWPHKNHEGALQALRILKDRYHRRPQLICTGSAKQAHARLSQVAQRLGVQDQLRFLGRVADTDLPALYEGAQALFFPSLFEGFGMPLVEAMWCECPIVCSNTTSLPEVAGDAALLVNPEDHAALAEALQQLHQSPELRAELVQRGLARAELFSWERFTLTVLKCMHTVHAARWRGEKTSS